MSSVHRRSIETDVGRLLLVQVGDSLSRLSWSDEIGLDDTPLLSEATAQLTAYFSGELKTFDLPLVYHASDFQIAACEAMTSIPYGETITYAELATQLGSSAQAAGNACGGNPLPIIVPCHRVLGTRGLGGYSGEGGIETKINLLKLEQAIPWLI